MSVELEKLYTFREAMDYLRLSRSTLQRLLDTGQIIGRKIGGTWRFTKQEMDAALHPSSIVVEKPEQGEETASQSC